jgi:hypothetical protein
VTLATSLVPAEVHGSGFSCFFTGARTTRQRKKDFSMSTSEITLKNIGPIQQLEIPLPEGGGVVVLRGSQGSGKSTALRAIEAAAGGKPDGVSLRDGATRGSVEFCGATLSVTKSRTSRRGALQVETIEGKYDIGALVDPQIKDPERADAARIKQLIALTGATPDVSAYRELFGDHWDRIDVDDATDDPIELYGRVVRDAQKYARSLEKRSDEQRIDLDSITKDTDADVARCKVSVSEAQDLQDQTTQRLAELRAKAQSAATQLELHTEAEAKLAELEARYDGPTVKEAGELVSNAEDLVADMRAKLNLAERELERLRGNLEYAARHEQQVIDCRKILDGTKPEQISAETVEAAQREAEEARRTLILAVAAKEHQSRIANAKEANVRADRIAEDAEQIRELCKKCEDVLASLIPKGEIRVEGNRLVVATDRSSAELYADLSHGERAILAIRAAARYIPAGGVATISQELWGGISEENRRLISREAKEHGVTILTAQVTDGSLEVEVVE